MTPNLLPCWKSARFLILCFLTTIWLGQPVGVSACNVPVFRYAFERWPADIYRFTIFSRGPLTTEQKVVADLLRDAGRKRSVNEQTRVIDLNGKLTPSVEQLWKEQGDAKLPLLVVQFPVPSRIEATPKT